MIIISWLLFAIKNDILSTNAIDAYIKEVNEAFVLPSKPLKLCKNGFRNPCSIFLAFYFRSDPPTPMPNDPVVDDFCIASSDAVISVNQTTVPNSHELWFTPAGSFGGAIINWVRSIQVQISARFPRFHLISVLIIIAYPRIASSRISRYYRPSCRSIYPGNQLNLQSWYCGIHDFTFQWAVGFGTYQQINFVIDNVLPNPDLGFLWCPSRRRD